MQRSMMENTTFNGIMVEDMTENVNFAGMRKLQRV